MFSIVIIFHNIHNLFVKTGTKIEKLFLFSYFQLNPSVLNYDVLEKLEN